MAYDNSHVWVVYNVLTAAQMTQISDNFSYLYTEVTVNRVASGVGGWIPGLLANMNGSAQTALTANRIYVYKFPIWNPVKILSFNQYNCNGAATGKFGAGIYNQAGTTLLVSGVTGNVAANNNIACVPVAPVLVLPGMYLLCATCDAAGILAGGVNSANVFLGGGPNGSTATLGYTATASAAGVLPASINTALTAISAQGGPFPSWYINTTTI